MATIAALFDVRDAYMRRSGSALAAIYDKVLHGERLTGEDGMRVYDDADLIAIGILADTARALRTPENTRDYVYWAHNFHINPTNICEAHCRFCSFKKGRVRRMPMSSASMTSWPLSRPILNASIWRSFILCPAFTRNKVWITTCRCFAHCHSVFRMFISRG